MCSLPDTDNELLQVVIYDDAGEIDKTVTGKQASWTVGNKLWYNHNHIIYHRADNMLQ